MNGAGAGRVSRKGKLEGLSAGAGARENRHSSDRTKTNKRREDFSCGSKQYPFVGYLSVRKKWTEIKEDI